MFLTMCRIVTWALCQDDFLRDHVPYILAFAFADNAFVGYSDPAAMFNAEMGFNIEKITCETREELREVHIFRKSGKSNEPYTQSQWDAAFKLATRQAGYTANITVHRIRSATTQRVNATGISDAQHCHLFGQSMSTFKKHYMNELTSIDAQAITHGERPRLDVAKVLRSASLSICRGLPTKLTAAQDSDVLRVLQNDPEILELERCRDQAQYAGDEASATKFRNKIDKRRSRARLERLKIEQTNYHQSQLAASQDPETSSTIAQQRWCRLMQLQPQHARIANTLEERRHPTTKERIALVQDLIDMVQQEEQSLGIALQQNKPSVCYNGFPAHGTGYQQHIQQPRNLVPETVDIIETCALCISQIPTTQIDAHITERHLHDIPTDCGVFYHTTERQGQLINPGLCPFCLSDDSLPLPGRFRGFTARRDHLDHLIRHLKLIPQGQLDCPHPNCTTSFSHDTLFKHFEVVHGIEGLEQRIESKTNSRKRKRIEKEDGQQISLSASTTTSTNLSFLRTPSELGDHSWSEDSSVKPTTDPAQATKTNFEAWASQLDMMVLPFKVRNPEHNIGRVMKKRRANQGFNEH